MTKEECLQLGINYIDKYNNYPVSKKWNIKSAGCSRDRIYENWGNWPAFILDLRKLKDIGEYRGSFWNKGLTTSKTLLEDKYCRSCSNLFHSYSKDQKYCSKQCASKSPNMGGVRNGAGRAKTGYCDGIYCGSTYELAWVIYNLDNNIPFTRCTDYFMYAKHKYYPDFLQNGVYIEIKGYHTELVDIKAKAVENSGNIISILYKEDLQYCFDWVKNNYDCPIEWLFDNYKPLYTYTCSFCKNDFTTDKKRKTNTVYCSRFCSGYGVRLAL